MTDITSLKRIEPPELRVHVAERLQALKAALRAEVHGGSNERSLRLATWNIMHFGSGGGYVRRPESMLYIAEIIDHFDLVAVQEVNRDLAAFERLVRNHLGSGWDYIVTDASGSNAGKDAGNSERLAFLYRRSKVNFRREAGEIVLPEGQEIAAPGDATIGRKVQFARTPFSVAFQAGWFKFRLCIVHIFYGDNDDDGPKMEQRRAEIEKIAGFLAERQQIEADNPGSGPGGRDANYILLGDFNIVSPEHQTMQALETAGFEVPTRLQKTNLGNSHHYDQIAVKAADPRFAFINSGVFNMLEHVYRDDDAAFYVDVIMPEIFATNSKGEPRDREQQLRYFKTYFRRHQMSDHQLLWCELKIDYSDDYIAELLKTD